MVTGLLLLSLSGARAVAVQAEREALDGLQLGIRLVEQGDYAAAIDVLEAVAIELEADRAEPRDMAQSYFYAGVARVFIVGDDEARFAFLEAQRHDPEFRPAETEFPRRVIRLWEEASTLEVEPESAAGGEPTGTLTVTTQPAGATVYVAGRPRGETPVEVAGLRSGDHRVTIVREGYVNNSRIIALAPSRNELLDIELTPVVGGAAAAELDDGRERDGNWLSRHWKWVLPAAGGGVASYLYVTRNRPPVAALNISPNGTGMAGATHWRFDGSGSSDPNNDRLTYSWDFGDGARGSGATTTHVYDRPGTFTVSLTVTDEGQLAAMTTHSVMVARNLEGRFRGAQRGTLQARESRIPVEVDFDLTFTQNRETIGGTGRLTLTERGGDRRSFAPVSIRGGVSDTTDFVCPCDVQFALSSPRLLEDVVFRGQVDNGATTLTGTLLGNPVTLSRR